MAHIKIKLWQKFLLITIILALQPILIHAEETGSIELNIKYTNGDRVDSYGMSLKVYQDFNKTPYTEIESVSSNPYNIDSLPLGHRYTVEVYVNSMYSSVGYVNLQKTQEKLDISIPLSGGLRFNVFFKDGITPMSGATVVIKSQDGKQWGEQITDDLGQTQRLWVQSTTRDSDHYVADIILSDDIKHTFSPIRLTAGEKYEYKIVTPWPSIIDDLITVNVYKNTSTKVGSSDGKFVVELYDSNENKVTESQVNTKGEAHFSKLKVDTYIFVAMKLENNTRQELNIKKITIIGSQNEIDIFPKEQAVIQKGDRGDSPSMISNCNCVAFRLDNIQDYWLNDVQLEIIKTFQKKNADLTLAIISTAFGQDPKITSFVKDSIKLNSKIEITNAGFEFKNFTMYDDEQRTSLLRKSNEKIAGILGVTPSGFVFSYGTINKDILDSISKNKIKYLSADVSTDPPPYPLSNSSFYRFPSTTTTYVIEDESLRQLTNEEILTNIKNSLINHGFAVVRLNFQHYAVNNDDKLKNEVDIQQIQQLEYLIDKIHDSGLNIVTIGKIGVSKSANEITIPSWIKNNAGWWADGKISDSDFVDGIQYMIQKKIIIIKNLSSSVQSDSVAIPSWIKNNAGWWADGKISDSDFAKGIEFLVSEGIIKA